MSVCIAAIGKEDEKDVIVFACDRAQHMAISDGTEVVYPDTGTKYYQLTSEAAILATGTALECRMFGARKFCGNIFDVRKQLQEYFLNFDDMIIDRVLSRHCVTREQYGNILQVPDHPTVSKIRDDVNEGREKLDIDILLIGFAGEKAEIFQVVDEFIFYENTQSSISVIGCGDAASTLSLLHAGQRDHTDLIETVYNVYKAKRSAEHVKGVGKTTDLIVMRKGQPLRKLDESELEILNKIYTEELNFGKSHQELKKLRLNNGETAKTTTVAAASRGTI